MGSGLFFKLYSLLVQLYRNHSSSYETLFLVTKIYCSSPETDGIGQEVPLVTTITPALDEEYSLSFGSHQGAVEVLITHTAHEQHYKFYFPPPSRTHSSLNTALLSRPTP